MVKVKAQDRIGKWQVLKGEGLKARSFCHEIDHLDGILFIDRLDQEQRKAAMRLIREAEWSGLTTPTVRVSPHATFGRGL